MDRWQDRGRTASASIRAELWPLVERFSIEAGVAGWRGSGLEFGTADTRLRWRSGAPATGTVMLAEAGYQVASANAPASLWPGADTGHARDVLLRAHPLLDDGIVRDGVFGRRMTFGSVEAQRWLKPVGRGLIRVAPAVFLDAAHAARGFAEADSRAQFDLGAGLRLAIPGAGALRIDVARGLRDGRTALSLGWQR
jgi:hypothetical protein